MVNGPEKGLYKLLPFTIRITELGSEKSGLAFAFNGKNEIRGIEDRYFFGPKRYMCGVPISFDGDFKTAAGDAPVGARPVTGGDAGFLSPIGVFTSFVDTVPVDIKVFFTQKDLAVVKNSGFRVEVDFKTTCRHPIAAGGHDDLAFEKGLHVFVIKAGEIGRYLAALPGHKNIAGGDILIRLLIIANLVGCNMPGIMQISCV